jgi:hypothetical protein
MARALIIGIVGTMIMDFSGSTTCDLHDAIHIVWLAPPDLDLDCSVRNPEIVLQLFGDLAEHVLPALHALLFNSDVAATTDHPRANRPNVEIMYC